MMQPAPDRAGRTDRPRFRQDLVAEPIEEQGSRFIDVMDPDSGNLFRFYEVEYSLACGMDGERDVAGIVKWAQEELGLTPSPQEVRTVIATLGDLGFIDAGAAGEAAAPEAAPELASGVVTQPQAAQPAQDVELGTAGAARREGAQARRDVAPSAPPLTLGASGGAAAARRAPVPSEDVELGNPGRGAARVTPAPPVAASSSDVSLDLADHLPVRRADVKEAVRQSKVMSAVDVPQDMLDAIEDKARAKPSEPARPAELKRPEPRPTPAPEPRQEPRQEPRPEPRPEPRIEARVEPRPEPRVEPRAEVRSEPRPVAIEPAPVPAPASRPLVVAKPPVELPKPPVVADHAIPPTASRSGVSPLLIILLIVAVGAGGFFLWKYVLQKPSADDTSVTPTTAPTPVAVQPPPPPAPPPAPPPTSKIAMEQPAAEEISVTAAGVIETILADKTVVKEGDVIVKLVGDKPIEAEITGATRELKALQDKVTATSKKLDAAKAAGNKASETQAETELAERETALAAKQALIMAKTTELERFLIHAKAGGTFAPAAKQGQKVAAGAVVAKLQRDAMPVAEFKVTDVKPFAAGAAVEVTVGKGEQHVSCTVAELAADSLKVACPADPALVDGADVTLKLPGAEAAGSAAEAAGSAAAAEAPAPAPGAAEGSAAPAAVPAPDPAK